MKMSNLLRFSALIPFFALMSALIPPEDSGGRVVHLRYLPVADRIGNAGETPLCTLLTSRLQYEKLFGEQKCSIDFNNEWAFFYSAGWKPTTGYEAQVVDVGYRQDVHMIVFTTQLASPGRNCVESPLATKPYSLVKFAIPPGRVDTVRLLTDDIVVSCDAK